MRLMTWLNTPDGNYSDFEAVLANRPELLELYRRYYGALWDEQLVPADILELARLRIAQLHESAAELAIRHEAAGLSDAQRDAIASWRTSPLFTPAQRAALEYAEMIPWQHHEITDEQARAVREQLGEKAFVAFTTALCLFDVNARLRILFDIEPRELAVSAPASAGGTLY
jgi:alkylhydroperoxidase family enzyme